MVDSKKTAAAAIAFAAVGGLAATIPAVAAGCTGNLGDTDAGSGTDGPSAQVLSEIGVSGMRRLTATEYDATVRDLVGIADLNSELVLPEDLRTPFDNDYGLQIASEALITSVESLSGSTAAAVAGDQALREAVVPCEPAGPADEACFRSFLTAFGRRAFRRPLTTEEIDRYATLLDHAVEANDFYVAVDSALRVFLQHPELLYRIEVGTPVEGQPGVFRLNDFELATRMSYFIWGSTPPPSLLDAAETGQLEDPASIRAIALDLFDDPRAHDRVGRFHSMWLGYERLPHAPALADAMTAETQALLDRVVFDEEGLWVSLLESQETFLTPELAEHYGLPVPASADWVSYGDSGRQGLLSQGSFLSAVAKFDDTSPTQRGLLIRTRLFCQIINPPPPNLMVDVDNPPMGPDPNACKQQKYNMWETDGCETCHQALEPVGFGLENYDMAGRYREHEPDRPECTIDGSGFLQGYGEFTGPAQLSDLIVQNPSVDSCVATYLYRFAMGRYELDEFDEALIGRIVAGELDEAGGLRLKPAMVELVSSEAFRHRREEVSQ